MSFFFCVFHIDCLKLKQAKQLKEIPLDMFQKTFRKKQAYMPLYMKFIGNLGIQLISDLQRHNCFSRCHIKHAFSLDKVCHDPFMMAYIEFGGIYTHWESILPIYTGRHAKSQHLNIATSGEKIRGRFKHKILLNDYDFLQFFINPWYMRVYGSNRKSWK